MENIFEWKYLRRKLSSGKEVEEYIYDTAGRQCRITKTNNNYIFVLWDYGAVKTSRDFNAKFKTLEDAKSFCESIMKK